SRLAKEKTVNNKPTKTGEIFTWQSGIFPPPQPPHGKNFVDIAVAGETFFALKMDGSIVAWGKNTYGLANTPRGKNFVSLAAGKETAYALTTYGTIVAWGSNKHGETH